METSCFHTLSHIALFCWFRPLHVSDQQPSFAFFFSFLKTIDSLRVCYRCTEERRVATPPIKVSVPRTTALPDFTFDASFITSLNIFTFFIIFMFVWWDKRQVFSWIHASATCWPDLKVDPSSSPSPAIASVTSTLKSTWEPEIDHLQTNQRHFFHKWLIILVNSHDERMTTLDGHIIKHHQTVTSLLGEVL